MNGGGTDQISSYQVQKYKKTQRIFKETPLFSESSAQDWGGERYKNFFFNPPMPEFFITREMGFVGVSIGKQIEKFWKSGYE